MRGRVGENGSWAEMGLYGGIRRYATAEHLPRLAVSDRLNAFQRPSPATKPKTACRASLRLASGFYFTKIYVKKRRFYPNFTPTGILKVLAKPLVLRVQPYPNFTPTGS